MIVDTSAVVAIIFQEPAHEELTQLLVQSNETGIGTPTLVECGIVLSARLGRDARGILSRFIEESDITIIPFTEAHFGTAVGAWIKYGKGRHPASLNFGDCLTYAMAKLSDMPLLCVGNDFSQTDVMLASA